MKVSSQAATALWNNKDSKEVPPLSLVPDESKIEQNDEAKKAFFKLLLDPTDTAIQKYSFTMNYAYGSQSIRFQIKWVKDVQKILWGMDMTATAAQHEMIQQLCSGQVLTQYNESIMIACQTAKVARTRAIVAGLRRRAATATVAGETKNEFIRRQANAQVTDKAVPPDPATLDMIEPVLRDTIKMVCPYKALEKQKRFMRRKMRKPANMKIRIFVNHLHRINFDELPQLPPFAADQELSNDELLDIILYCIPKSWVKEMDKQGFDPFAREDIQALFQFCKCMEDIILFGILKSWVKEMDKQDFDPFAREDVQALIQFCERMESAEDFHDNTNKQGSNSKNSHKKTKFSNKKGKPTIGSGKWCEYHKTNTHDTSECSVLKKMKESGRNNSSDKKPFNKNKTWTKKSDDAKKFSKKELNALVKKASEKAVKKATKELNAVAKRKRDNDNDSTSSLHMLKNEMKDVDDQLKNFNFEAVNEVKV
jgi:hypothetical protein